MIFKFGKKKNKNIYLKIKYLLRSKFLREIVASQYLQVALKIALPHCTCHVYAILHTTVMVPIFFRLFAGVQTYAVEFTLLIRRIRRIKNK